MLLQKADGTLMLVVWSERVSGSDEVTVDLGKQFAEVKVYNPTAGTEPIKTLAEVQSVKLSMSDHPYIIELPQP
jgi:hypothetical protein